VGWLRALALALILAAGLVAVDGVAASSTAPRPDPPPVKKTPPPPPVYQAPPPPVYQAPPPPVYQAPPPPVYHAPPPASGPTAALRTREAARREARMGRVWDTAPEDTAVVPLVAAATLAALIILGLALVPAQVVPWYRVSVALEDHRGHLTLVAGMGLLGAAVVFALTFLSS
jgi:hypothetical protein